MTLLDELARTSDPESSKAGARMDHSGLCARALRALVTGGAATTDELLSRVGEPAPDRNVIARRMTTLERWGLVADTGLRRPSRRGVPVPVWSATREGREVAARG